MEIGERQKILSGEENPEFVNPQFTGQVLGNCISECQRFETQVRGVLQIPRLLHTQFVGFVIGHICPGFGKIGVRIFRSPEVARNIPITSEIKEKYLFTEPIVLDKQVLIQRTEAANNGLKPIRNQLDLAGKTLYIPKDSPAQLRLQNLGHEIGDTIYVIEDELYSGEQLAIMVAKGDIDYAVCDQQTAALSQKQLPEIDIKTDISFTQLQSWAVRKDSPILLDSLNSWLEQIRKNGTFDKIYKKYYK